MSVLYQIFGQPLSNHRIYAAFASSLLIFYSTQWIFAQEHIPLTAVRTGIDKFFLPPSAYSQVAFTGLQGLFLVALGEWTFRWANGEAGPVAIALLLSLPSASIDLFLHSHYLVQTNTLVYHRASHVVSLALALSAAAYLVPFHSNYLSPNVPPPRRGKKFFNRLIKPEELLSQLLAPALGLAISTFLSYVSYRFFLENFFREHAVEILAPPQNVSGTAKLFELPLLHVPMLRPEPLYKGYQSIIPFITLNAPLPLSVAALYLVTPSSPAVVSNIITLSMFIDTFTTLGSKLPVDWIGALVVGLEAGIRAQIVARATCWALVDTKRAVRGETDKKAE
ncbi:hypothetical protein BT69DRAFT_1350420 [Atractiella rhizophila]|nr:hypothetical protein BT69DRAFT_1350420 [Atractiella rhizophila]